MKDKSPAERIAEIERLDAWVREHAPAPAPLSPIEEMVRKRAENNNAWFELIERRGFPSITFPWGIVIVQSSSSLILGWVRRQKEAETVAARCGQPSVGVIRMFAVNGKRVN